jgi:hypothetical protein
MSGSLANQTFCTRSPHASPLLGDVVYLLNLAGKLMN